jgi:hypothetical protein
MPAKTRKLTKLRNVSVISDIAASSFDILQRHRTGVNVLSSDGSAKWVPLQAFVGVKGHNPGPAASIRYDSALLKTFDSNYNTILLDETVSPVGGIWGVWDRY